MAMSPRTGSYRLIELSLSNSLHMVLIWNKFWDRRGIWWRKWWEWIQIDQRKALMLLDKINIDQL